MGSVLVDSLELRSEAGTIMARMAAELEEAVYLVVAAGTRAVCLERIDSGHGVRMADLYVGGSQPLNLGAAPRALLAFDEDRLLPALLEEGLSRRTEYSLVDPADLLADLAETRRRGYSISDEDVTAGIGAIGAPILNADGVAVAALSYGGCDSTSCHRDRHMWLACCRPAMKSRRGSVTGCLATSGRPGIMASRLLPTSYKRNVRRAFCHRSRCDGFAPRP